MKPLLLLLTLAVTLVGCQTTSVRNSKTVPVVPAKIEPPKTFHIPAFDLLGEAVVLTDDPETKKIMKEATEKGQRLTALARKHLLERGLSETDQNAADLNCEIYAQGLLTRFDPLKHKVPPPMRFEFYLLVSKPRKQKLRSRNGYELRRRIDGLISAR